MGLSFDGCIDDISEHQLAFIEKVLVERGFNNTKVTIDPVGIAGDNYLSNIKRITVTADNEIFKMIAKIAPRNEIKRKLINAHNLFKNEHVIYTEILPKFQELEVKAEVSNGDRLRFAACYGTCIEAPHEIILLEDLQASYFIMLDRLKPLSDECVRSVIKNFAILHSLSYVLKSKESDTFKAMKQKLFDYWIPFVENRQMIAHMSYIEKETEMIIDGEERKRAFKSAITQSRLIAKDVNEIDSKYTVIQQGDSWTNNIMFKFVDNKLQESVMIDYQLTKENSPAYDLQLMIFNCTDHKMRLENYHDWLEYYYSELDKCLSNFGLKANYIYPRDKLDDDINRYGKLIFRLSVFLISISTMKSEDAVKIKEFLEMKINVDDLPQLLQFQNFDQSYMTIYKTRIEDLIDSYLEFGLLEKNHI